MKTSIVRLSVNETLCVNGGIDAGSPINHAGILSTGRELIFSHSKQIGAASIGVVLTVASIAAKIAFNLSKENAAISILRETIKLAS